MLWTKSLPTEQGAYWLEYGHTANPDPCVVTLWRSDRGLMCSLPGSEEDDLVERMKGCYWAGPLEVPGEEV